MKHVLMLSPFHPFPPTTGGERRIYHLAKHLSRLHHVSLICPQPFHRPLPADTSTLSGTLIQVPERHKLEKFFNVAMLRAAVKFTRGQGVDKIFVEYTWPGFTAIALRQMTGVPFAVDEHNVEFLRFRDLGRKSWHLIRWYEKLTCQQAKHVYCVSQEDRNGLARLGISPEKISLLPNGFDAGDFFPSRQMRLQTRQALGVQEGTPLVLYFGSMDYPPNQEAAQILAKEIRPRVLRHRPEAQFVIAGRHASTDLAREGMRTVGFVERIQDTINAADVMACPLVRGGGTRLKILESIACGTPVVSTTVGAAGLDVSLCTPHLTIADDWDTFAQKLIQRLSDPVAVPVSPQFAERYSWENIAKRVEI